MSMTETKAIGKRDTLDHEDGLQELKAVLADIIQESDAWHCLAAFRDGNKASGVLSVSRESIDNAVRWIKTKAKTHDVYLTINHLKQPSTKPGKPWSGKDGSPTNQDVDRIRHVFIDVDQDDAPDGSKQTLPERTETAKKLAVDIEAFLQDEFGGVGISLLGCSGRGAQLWLRADLPAESASTKTIEAFIAILGEMYNGEGVHLDTGVNDLRRIARVCVSGLFNVKTGTAYPCELLHGAKEGRRITREDLQAFIEKYGLNQESPEKPLAFDSGDSSPSRTDTTHTHNPTQSEANAVNVRLLFNYARKHIGDSAHGDRRKSFQRMLKKFSGHLQHYRLEWMTSEVQGVLIEALKAKRPETTQADIDGMIRDIWDTATPTKIQEDRSEFSGVSTGKAPPAPAPEDEETTPGIFFPNPMHEAAFIGPIGRWAKLILPRTEASVENLLMSGLIAFGNALGRSCFYEIGSTKHYPNEFLLIVGQTAKARKGTGLSEAKALMRELDPDWAKYRVKSGLASGEGLIHQIRDEKRAKQPVREGGRVVDYQDVIVDEGVQDKRLLLVEEEFSRVLKISKREDNTVSDVIRLAWDSEILQVTAKKAGEIASDPHVSIIGQITREEFGSVVSPTDISNGLLNRFLFCAVHRSKLLPIQPPAPDPSQLGAIVAELKAVIDEVKDRPYRIGMTSEAAQEWQAFYNQLPDRDGIIGNVTGRDAPHIIRIAMIYALSEDEADIDIRHLEAALAVWTYCEASVEWVFQRQAESDAKTLDDQLLEALAKVTGKGLKRSEITKTVFRGNRTGDEIKAILHRLVEKRRIKCHKVRRSTGKPIEFWYLAEYFPPDPSQTP